MTGIRYERGGKNERTEAKRFTGKDGGKERREMKKEAKVMC